jgi:WD40 repeat protein
MVLSRDGTRLVTAGSGPGDKLCIWDMATGALVMSAPGEQQDVVCLAVSPDAQQVAVGDKQGTLDLWNVGRAPAHLETLISAQKEHGIRSVASSPDGKLLAAGSGNGTVWIWQVGAGKEPLIIEGPEDSSVWSVAFSPDGKALASGGFRVEVTTAPDGGGAAHAVGKLCLWDPASGRKLLDCQTEADEPMVVGVTFSPDGRSLASLTQAGKIMLWDAATGRRMRTFHPRAGTMPWRGGIAFSPDGRLLATGGPGCVISLWDIATGEPVFRDLEGHVDMVDCVAVSPDGGIVASGSVDGTIRLCLKKGFSEFSARLTL